MQMLAVGRKNNNKSKSRGVWRVHIQRGAWAEINLDAVAHNVQTAKANLRPSTKLCAVVKADAYGHGAVRVAQEAARNGADFFAVALLQEAVKLRDAGIDQPILVLGSLLPEVADICVRQPRSF